MDRCWLLTEWSESGSNIQRFRIWHLGAELPTFSYTLPLGAEIGSRLVQISDELINFGKILPVGERSFLFQKANLLFRLDLPHVSIPPERVEAATAATLAVCKDEYGQLRSLTRDEFRAARAAVIDH